MKAHTLLLALVTVLTLISGCSKPISDAAPQFVCYYYHRTDTIPATADYQGSCWQVYRDIECPQPINDTWAKIHDSVFAFALCDSTRCRKNDLKVLYEYPPVVVKDTESTYAYNHNDYISLRTYHISDSLYGFYCHTKWYDMGCHGSEGYYYRYFNTQTGDLLTVADIVTSAAPLTNYLDSAIRLSEKAWGILADTIRPNDNFIISSEGLTFVYNQYEIACFATDTFLCLVPFTKFQPCLKGNYSYLWNNQ